MQPGLRVRPEARHAGRLDAACIHARVTEVCEKDLLVVLGAHVLCLEGLLMTQTQRRLGLEWPSGLSCELSSGVGVLGTTWVLVCKPVL